MTMEQRNQGIEGVIAELQEGTLQTPAFDLRTLGLFPRSDGTGLTRFAGLITETESDAKPRNRANRCCRQQAYQVCLARSRVRLVRVASIISFPYSSTGYCINVQNIKIADI